MFVRDELDFLFLAVKGSSSSSCSMSMIEGEMTMLFSKFYAIINKFQREMTQTLFAFFTAANNQEERVWLFG